MDGPRHTDLFLGDYLSFPDPLKLSNPIGKHCVHAPGA